MYGEVTCENAIASPAGLKLDFTAAPVGAVPGFAYFVTKPDTLKG